jgi:hypothetical protein
MKRKLPQTQEAMDKEADKFLLSNGFPSDFEYTRMFGMCVQGLPEKQDWYDPKLFARQIRKAVANELAFYLIKPERRSKKDETPNEPQVKGI